MSNGFYMGQQGLASSGAATSQLYNQGYNPGIYQNHHQQAPSAVTPASYGYTTPGHVDYTQQQFGSQFNQIETGTSYGHQAPLAPRRGGRGGRGRGRGSFQQHHQQLGPRQIKATEIKAFIYAWCGQMKRKPEYTYETIGAFPRVTYKCTIQVHGYPTVECEARSKKEAQTLAAWAFSDKLVETNQINAADLPPRPECQVRSSSEEVTKSTAESDLDDLSNGGWTAENARPRLNRFCMMERISCDFQNHSEGPCHKKVSISTLEFNIDRATQQPLRVSVRASNKKTANAQCAKEMVRLLFKEGLIERCGEKIMQKETTAELTPYNQAHHVIVPGQKRRISGEIEFDSNGNWTLETAKARLSKFYTQHKLDFQSALACSEIGHPPHRQYQCQFQVDIEPSTTFNSCVVADNKKAAQRKASLDMVIKLYCANLIEGNRGDRFSTYPAKRGRGMSRGSVQRGASRGGGVQAVTAMVAPTPMMVPPSTTTNGFKTFATM